MAGQLLEKGFAPHGLVRRSSPFTRDRIHHLHHDERSLDRNLRLHYGDVTDGMRRKLQADEPDDFVLASGTAYTIKQFLTLAFEHAGLESKKYVKFDPKFLRPTEVEELIGDAGNARTKLGWEAKLHPPELARVIVDADVARLEGPEKRPGRT